MKRVLTFAIVMMLVVTMFAGLTMADEGDGYFKNDGRNATYAVLKFAPVGYSWSGIKMYPDRQRTFEVNGTYTGFGRREFLMPACTDNPVTGAVQQPGGGGTSLYNIPATTPATSVEPRFWCEVYLTIRPDGARATEEDHWFVVVDSGGNVWFDPDGYFHDSRYYAYADPQDNRYAMDNASRFDHCTRNPNALVDPIRSNNTQGPYPLFPTTESGAVNPGYIDYFQANVGDTNDGTFPTTGMGSTPMYFMPPNLDGRIFRIGWVDRVDFPLIKGGSDDFHPYNRAIDGALHETVVGGSHRADTWITQASYWGIPADNFWQNRWDDWDQNMPLVRFRDGIGPALEGPDAQFWAVQTFDPTTLPYDNDLQWGEEWHAENLGVNGVYDPGEWIYRAGWLHSQFGGDSFIFGYDPFQDVEVHVYGDLRLTPVSVHIKTGSAGSGGLNVLGGFTYNYAPGTVPIDRGRGGIPGTNFGFWDPGDDYDIGHMDNLDNTGLPDPQTTPRALVQFVLSPLNFGTPDPGLSPTEDDELHAENISARGVGISGAPVFDPYEHIYKKGYALTTTGRSSNDGDMVEYGDLRLSNVNSNAHPWGVRNFTGSNPNALGGLWINDCLVVAEVLTAVCNDNDYYNLSVETDLWEGMIPSQCSATLRSQVGEIVQRTQTINKSTVLGPTPTSFAVPATTFMDCHIGSRQYMGVEIFVDNGVDNNLGVQHYLNDDEYPPDTDRLLYNNLSDDYRPGRTGEMFLGAVDPPFSMGNLTDLLAGGSAVGEEDFYMQSMVGKDVGRKLTRLDTLNPPVRFRDSALPSFGGGAPHDGIYYGCQEAIYVDMDDDYDVSRGDVRMTDMKIVRSGAIIEYKAGSVVNEGDVDVNSFLGAGNDLHIFTSQQFTQGVWQFPMFYDDYTVNPNNPNVIIPPNGTYDLGEIIYNTTNLASTNLDADGIPGTADDNDAFVMAGFTRLTAGWVGDTYYECGSVVPSWDFWLNPSVAYGVTTGLNCDFRFMDWEVIPGDINLDVKLNKPLMVEQTSDIQISVDPPPRKGHWRDLGDHRVWIPDEKIYVMIRENVGVDYRGAADGDASLNLYSTFRVLTPNAPEATFTLTPYRGSCNPFPMLGIGVDTEAQYRVQAFKMNPEIDVFANRTGRANMRVVPPDQHPGYHNPTADNPFMIRHETRHYYRDMHRTGDWYNILNHGNPLWRHWNKLDKTYTPGYRVPGMSLPEEEKTWRDLAPCPPLPVILSDHYDCYGEYYMPVAPENLEIEASVACITTLDQRFPNVLLKINDVDNENDVNDPYGIPFAIPKSDSEVTPLVAYYNATGGGIDWIGVAELSSPSITNEKIIFQANTDGTYDYWYWYEPANVVPELGPQVIGAIDPNDWIIGEPWGDFTDSCPVGLNREAIHVDDRSTWDDADCSADIEYTNCDINLPEGMKPIGDVTGYAGNALSSDHFGLFDGGFGWILSYGVPTYITPFGEVTSSDEGGECLITLKPSDGSTHVKIHLYLTNAIFDYNSSSAHPFTGGPYFRYDNTFGVPAHNQSTIFLGKPTSGIDYAGFIDLKVYQADPYVNFAEWLIVDKAIQYSNVNYTAGNTINPPLSPLPPPAPQIQVPYWPILRTSHGGFRCYPGGQTHTGRVEGANFNQNGGSFGWNAYPAIWSEITQKDVKAEKFYKLGTEFFPLTDYGLYFILKDGKGNHLSFEADNIERQLKQIVVEGPFARPKIVDVLTKSVANEYCYNGLKNVPIQYDFSGKLVIDETNWNQYEHNPGGDFLNWSALGDVDLGTNENLYMVRTKRLNYCSLENVFVIDELIPWNYGKILIYVTLMDGTFKMYQDCCTSPPVDGIDVRALDIQQINSPDSTVTDSSYDFIDFLTLDQDNLLSFTVKEHEEIQVEALCNNAVMFCWQDRGVVDLADPERILRTGAGDGWITNCPTSSRAENYATQFRPDQDVNDDGFIRFNDFETEILGSYDMATNTWVAGIIDARTFQRNGGRYDFELSEDNGCVIDEVGIDFGGEMGECDEPDHIISDNELFPLYVTAYKYGDDNNDRGFSPWWDFDPYYATLNASNEYDRTRYSHEVYLAGQMAIKIEPFDDLIVTYLPNPLTAGITPELVDVNSPLTFIIKDKDGEPVNLLDGMIDQYGETGVEEKNVWNYLFKDPHPDNQYYYGQGAMLPQYYFLRTDLHNYDSTRVNNRELYSARERDESNQCKELITTAFEPIEFHADGEAGRYYFKGFCANDSNVWLKDEDHPDRDSWEDDHKMRVFVYTPDRRHRGYVDVMIENPRVEYEITNTEDPTLQVFSVPGEPDFLMTAADNRLYKVRATVYNAQGVLVKGVSKGVSVCGGGVKNTARFTPFSTRPASFDFMQTSCDKVPCCEVVYPHFGYDFNANSNIEWQNKELYAAGSFHLTPITNSCWDRQAVGEVYYNTVNEYYEYDNTWKIINEGTTGMSVEWVNLMLPPPGNMGWGLGAIYNNPYWGGFLFTDIDRNGKLDYHDSLSLDVNAQTTFYVFAEDCYYVGGLVGQNIYGNIQVESDIVGYPPYTDKTNPRYTWKRFRGGVTNDTTFALDWEGIPLTVAPVTYPRIELFDAETDIELNKDLINVDNYDFVYRAPNHVIARIYPATREDVMMKEDGRLYVAGSQEETQVFGHTKNSMNYSGATETTFHITPQGDGQSVINLSYLSRNKYYVTSIDCCDDMDIKFNSPEWYCLRNIYHIDSAKGLSVVVASSDLAPMTETELTIIVTQTGTELPVGEATVYLEGPGIEASPKTTNAKGEVKIVVMPDSAGRIFVTVEHDDYIPGKTWIGIGADNTPPMLSVDAVMPFVNTPSIEVTGTTDAGVKVTVNGVSAKVEKSGKFKAKIALKEGNNIIYIQAVDAGGNKVSHTTSTVLDTTKPSFIIDGEKDGILMVAKDAKNVTITGRVEPFSKVTANGKPAKCPYDMWEVVVPMSLSLDTLKVKFEFVDQADNVQVYEVTITRE
jgi:Glucodextranase, domain B